MKTVVLRWIFFLPGALLGAALGWLASRSVVVLSSPVDPSQQSLAFFLVSQALVPLSMGIGYILLGTAIAPSHRLHAGVALCGLFLFLSGAACFSEYRGWLLYLAIACLNIGAIGTTIYQYVTERNTCSVSEHRPKEA